MRTAGVPIGLVAAAGVGAVFGLLVGLGVVPLPGIGPPAGVTSRAAAWWSAVLGAVSGGFFGAVLCLFMLSIVSARRKLKR